MKQIIEVNSTVRTKRIFLISAGILTIIVAVLADHIFGQPFSWGTMQTVGVIVGGLMVLIGFIPTSPSISRILIILCLFLICHLLAELFFRVVHYDFVKEGIAWQRTPPFYRQPTVPIGEVFFRRPGPQEWHGQVLNTRLKQLRIVTNPYMNEEAITIKYDSDGFRNPLSLEDWQVVVTGDSFTEQGYLPDEDLFTTIIGDMLELKVKNLGTSYTGPLTQTFYLQNYGISSSTQHAIMILFEGTALKDITQEHEALRRWLVTGRRKLREQTSMIKAIVQFISNLRPRRTAVIDKINAFFKSPQGDVPIELDYTPPDISQVTADTIAAFDFALKKYAMMAHENNIKAWLVYAPCKRRVLHGKLRFLDNTSEEIKTWVPTDLPDLVYQLCNKHGISFIDLTNVLVKETDQTGVLLFNPVYDTHFNAYGSRIVAQEIVRHLKKDRVELPNKNMYTYKK